MTTANDREPSEVQRTLLRRLRDEWTAMEAADRQAEHHRRQVDRLMSDAMAEGVGARTIGREVGVVHSNIVRRVQRHRRSEQEGARSS